MPCRWVWPNVLVVSSVVSKLCACTLTLVFRCWMCYSVRDLGSFNGDETERYNLKGSVMLAIVHVKRVWGGACVYVCMLVCFMRGVVSLCLYIDLDTD